MALKYRGLRLEPSSNRPIRIATASATAATALSPTTSSRRATLGGCKSGRNVPLRFTGRAFAAKARLFPDNVRVESDQIGKKRSPSASGEVGGLGSTPTPYAADRRVAIMA